MAWTTPTLVEICIGLEINGYLPTEFRSGPTCVGPKWGDSPPSCSMELSLPDMPMVYIPGAAAMTQRIKGADALEGL